MPPRSDDEIAARIAAGVASGKIRPEFARMYASALQDEANCDGIVIRNPKNQTKAAAETERLGLISATDP